MSAPRGEIEYLTFAVAGDDENRRDSVVTVSQPEIFDNAPNPRPISGGVQDGRLGAVDMHNPCITCEQGRGRCPGHPGTIEMRTHLPSPMFISEIRRWLRVVCHSCGSPVIPFEKHAAVPPERRFEKIAKQPTKFKKCPKCGADHPNVVQADDDSFGFLVETLVNPEEGDKSERKSRRLSPDEVREIFDRVTAETVEASGRPQSSRPQQLLIRSVLVAPNTMRPGVRMGVGPSGAASHHDITNLLRYLVRQNGDLPDALPKRLDDELSRRVQNAEQVLYEMIVGSPVGRPSSSSANRRAIQFGSRPTTSVVRNFARKSGRFRRNLMGKRTRLISRSTISGNPHLRPNQIGFPEAFARVLQVEETVQEYNRERLRKYYLNGTSRYPGCSRIIKRSTGRTHRVEDLNQGSLEIGDILLRDVIDGDFAHLNRQPSLERSSIGVHEVVILRDPTIDTFQLNVLACANYNADFDGDQMNLWVSHSVMARAEAGIMSSFSNWFISSKSSAPINGEVQDSVISSFELTRDSARLDKLHMMRLFATTQMEPPDLSAYGADTVFTGRDAISFLLESTPINYDKSPTWFDQKFATHLDYSPTEIRTVIRRGKMLSGVLDKRSIGEGSIGGIFHLIARDFGPRKALDVVFALQQMSIAYVKNQGFTVSTDDMIVSKKAQFDIQTEVATLLADAKNNTDRLIRGDLTPPIGMTTREFYERLQREALKMPDTILGPVIQSIDPDQNGLFRMVATGSKGKKPNIKHISAAIGQVEVNSKRVPEQFGPGRTNVYYPAYSTDPRAKGFIPNNFIIGMDSRDAIPAAQNGRFDLISKALTTATTGFQQRKSTMALQSAMINNHRRLVKGTAVVQILYGEDGLDPRAVEQVKFRTALVSDDELRRDYRLAAPKKPQLQKAADEAFAAVVADRETYRRQFFNFERTRFGTMSADVRLMPVNVARVVRDSIVAHEDTKTSLPTADEQIAMIHQVATFCADLVYAFGNEMMEALRVEMPEPLTAATTQLQMLVRAELAPPVLARLSPAQLEGILARIRFIYEGALIDYGSAMGIVASQAVSEPLTQYMLDSHHRSVGSGTDAAGIQRPLEIFTAKPPESERSSEMMISPLPEHETSEAKVTEIANQIELMSFGRFVAQWGILLEPIGSLRYPPFAADAEWIADFRRHHPLLPPPRDLTNWCMRFVLDKSEMILKGVDLAAIIEQLRAKVPHVYIVHSSENVPAVVIRIFTRAADTTEEKLLERLRTDVLTVVVRGVPGITTATVVPVSRHHVDADGRLVARKVFAIKTVGSNIYGVLLNRYVDPYRVVSSSIGETIRVFGLAAGRDTIIREIRRFMGSSAPNVRHLQVYASEMVRTGKWTSLEPRGVRAREKNNLLLRMGMSAPRQVLEEAALNNMSGNVEGLVPSLVAGRSPSLGSTWNPIYIDCDYVKANTQTIDSLLDDL